MSAKGMQVAVVTVLVAVEVAELEIDVVAVVDTLVEAVVVNVVVGVSL